jgi:hypothetical protein
MFRASRIVSSPGQITRPSDLSARLIGRGRLGIPGILFPRDGVGIINNGATKVAGNHVLQHNKTNKPSRWKGK